MKFYSIHTFLINNNETSVQITKKLCLKLRQNLSLFIYTSIRIIQFW